MSSEKSITSRRSFIKLAGAGAVSAAISPLIATRSLSAESKGKQQAKKNSGRPPLGPRRKPYNMVLILTDQERYFSEFPKSAGLNNRERLKNMGTSFEKHYTCTNMCTASRSVIYTGQHIQKTGMFDNTNSPWQPDMSTDLTTIGHRLRQAGYYTAYKGKLHLSRKAEPDSSGRLKTDALEPYGFSDYNPEGDEYGHVLGGYSHDNGFASSGVEWLRKKGQSLNKEDKPFFLALNLVNPHDIMYFNTDHGTVTEQDTGNLTSGINKAPRSRSYQKSHPDFPLPDNLYQPMEEAGRPKAHYEYTRCFDSMLGSIPNKDENWRRYRDYYLNCLKDVDDQIGRFLDELEDQGLMENTVVVFTADHGEMAGNHNLRGKGPFSYEENIHLPLYIVHPEMRGGKKVQALSTHLDLVPTLLDLAAMDKQTHGKVSTDLPGKSLASALKNGDISKVDDVRPATLYCYDMFATVDSDYMVESAKIVSEGGGSKEIAAKGLKMNLSKRGSMRTIFDGRYKFTRYFAPLEHNTPKTYEELVKYNDLELFDLKNDPKEMVNLAANPKKNKKLIVALNTKMSEMIRSEVGEDVGQDLPQYPIKNWSIVDFSH